MGQTAETIAMTIIVDLDQDLTRDRDVRMLTALLVACDPCGQADGDPLTYVCMAGRVQRRLCAGADLVSMVELFRPDVSVDAAVRFARAALDWWNNSRNVRTPGSLPAAAAVA